MYANLLVRLPYGPGKEGHEEVFCHKVEYDPLAGRIVLHLDDPMDQSSYAAPMGTREVPLKGLGARKLEVTAFW
jgi:hypothetical protein